MKDRLGVGIIGAGFMANFHIRSWQGVREADIVGIVDLNESRARAAAESCRALGVGDPKIYRKVSDMVAAPEVDAIWIVAPNNFRVSLMQQIVDTLESGKGKLIGIACEKPLALNVGEARKMIELVEQSGVLHAYLENQCHAPAVTRGRDIIWRRGAAVTGPPFLARCAEEHSGPHEPWFWKGEEQGGGVLNDMMCHSIQAARFFLSDPAAPKGSLVPKTVNAEIGCLKWALPHYAEMLKKNSGGQVDYFKHPAEDFARATVTFEDANGRQAVAEVSTSWSYVGPGLRLNFEVMGPEYSLDSSSLNTDLNIYFSRNVTGKEGEDLVEKQNAEQGMLPVVPSEEIVYGYTEQDRQVARAFREGRQPEVDFYDGLLITQILMTAYMSAEQGRKLAFPPPGLDEFIPAVAKGTWKAGDLTQGLPPEA
ncbi:Gfo/Idh/MocA family protein [Gemmatimonadota bacterium]